MASDVITRSREVAVGRLEQIPPGEGRVFEVGPHQIAIFRTRAGAVFATQTDCPHRGGPLADGMLGGQVILCPLHDRAFDLVSGVEIGGDCRLATYPVREADGILIVALPE